MIGERDDKNTLHFESLCGFFVNSWIYAFRILENIILRDKEAFEKLGAKLPTPRQMDDWSLKCSNSIKNYLMTSLKESLIDPLKGMDFETFKRWLAKDEKTIQVGYANKILNVCATLNCLDDYGFAEGSKV